MTELSQQLLSQLPSKLKGSNISINIVMGDFTMTDSSRNMVGNFSNNTGVVNQGDHNEINQGGKGNSTNGDFEKLIQALLEEIKISKEINDKEDAISDTVNIEKAVNEGKLDRAKRLYGALSDSVRTLASAATLAKFLGL
ncbi:hypothetical protein ACIOBL_13070 [Paenibacillus taichungensis]|uniref:hypothetical protein n=1 Tax=Paenibacillus taichungensis TaxID=484184 RepID=UPI00380562A6